MILHPLCRTQETVKVERGCAAFFRYGGEERLLKKLNRKQPYQEKYS